MREGSHLLIESADAPGQGLGVYARAAVADGNPNLIQSMLIAGLAGHSLVPGRPQDSFGVGYFLYNFSDKLRNAFRPARRFENEQGVEAFYVFVPLTWLRLTPSLQWVRPADGTKAEILLGGLRARVEF
jgi:porin